jgi:hypothetical protein
MTKTPEYPTIRDELDAIDTAERVLQTRLAVVEAERKALRVSLGRLRQQRHYAEMRRDKPKPWNAWEPK